MSNCNFISKHYFTSICTYYNEIIQLFAKNVKKRCENEKKVHKYVDYLLTCTYSSAIIDSTTEQRQSDAVRQVSMNINWGGESNKYIIAVDNTNTCSI